jgi:ABC-type phosphate/phosphonate transport system substrate-binding protein
MLNTTFINDPASSLRYLRDPEAVMYFLEGQFAEFGITRSPSLAKTWQIKGSEVLWESEKFPVYALIVLASVDVAFAERMRTAMLDFAPGPQSPLRAKSKIAGFEFGEALLAANLQRFR